MPLPVLPSLAGLEWPVGRKPKSSNLVQKAISGRTTDQPLWAAPLYDYTISFSGLNAQGTPRGAFAANEWQTWEDFWKTVIFGASGPANRFAYTDPNDNAVANQVIATGDGVTTSFQLARALLSFLEPVLLPTSVALFRNDWQGNQLLYPTPRTNLLSFSQNFDVSGTTNAANAHFLGRHSEAQFLGRGFGGWSPGGSTRLHRTSLRDMGAVATAIWTLVGNATIAGSAGAAPDGSNTAYLLTDTSAVTLDGINQAISIPANSAFYLASLFVKKGTGPIFELRLKFTPGGGQAGVAFDPATGNWTSSSNGTLTVAPTVTPFPGGWWRTAIQIQNDGTQTQLNLRFAPAGAAALNTPVNQISTVTTIVVGQTGNQLIWGAQLEPNVSSGAAPTSYVKTGSSALSVTDYVLGNYGALTLAAAPLPGATLSWTGSYDWLCRFSDDSMDLSNFAFQFFSLKKIGFETTRP